MKSAPLFVTVAALAACRPSPSGDIDFSGQTVRLYIPFKEGGGSDTWARFNAPFLSRYLPGEPTVVVKNIPGGGSIKGANRFAVWAKPNGLSLLGTSGSTQFPFLLDDPRVKYDYSRWRVLTACPTGGVVYVSPKLGIRDASELAKRKNTVFVYGSQGATSLDLVPLLAFDLLGLKVRAVFGIRGRGAGRLAFERGETNIDYQTSSAYIRNVKPLVAIGEAVPLFSWGTLDENGQWSRDAAFPELPGFDEVYEMLHGAPPSGVAWESWLAFTIAGFSAQKFFVAPIETPENIADAYRAAFAKMAHDPEFQKRREVVIGTYEQVTGKNAERLYQLGTTVSESSKVWVQSWLRTKYGINLRTRKKK